MFLSRQNRLWRLFWLPLPKEVGNYGREGCYHQVGQLFVPCHIVFPHWLSQLFASHRWVSCLVPHRWFRISCLLPTRWVGCLLINKWVSCLFIRWFSYSLLSRWVSCLFLTRWLSCSLLTMWVLMQQLMIHLYIPQQVSQLFVTHNVIHLFICFTWWVSCLVFIPRHVVRIFTLQINLFFSPHKSQVDRLYPQVKRSWLLLAWYNFEKCLLPVSSMAPTLLGFYLGCSSNFVGSQSGKRHSDKQQQKLVSNTTQQPPPPHLPPPPSSHTLSL